jgi:hypothetical protein
MVEYQELSLEAKQKLLTDNSVVFEDRVRWVRANTRYYESIGYVNDGSGDIPVSAAEVYPKSTGHHFTATCQYCGARFRITVLSFWKNVLRDRHYGRLACLPCENRLVKKDPSTKKRNLAGEHNPMFGKIQSQATREKIRQHHLENKEMFSAPHRGKSKSLLHRQHLSESALADGRNKGENNPRFGTKVSEETRLKISTGVRKWRMLTIMAHKMLPCGIAGYNVNTLPLFQKIKEYINSTDCYYAENPYEYKVIYTPQGNAFFLDFISFDQKLIIEYDEPHHQYRQRADRKRKKIIQQLLPEFLWITIEERLYSYGGWEAVQQEIDTKLISRKEQLC